MLFVLLFASILRIMAQWVDRQKNVKIKQLTCWLRTKGTGKGTFLS
jgi:hypothetical protein